MVIAALVIGILALLVGLLTVSRMMWSSPKLKFTFTIEDMEKLRYYDCEIHNVPITNKFLRKMGVRREPAQDVTAAFEILERETMKVICPLTIAFIKTQTGVGAQRIVLPASFFPPMFAIIYVDKNTNEVSVMRENKFLLPVGAYIAQVTVAEGQHTHIGWCNFIVDDKHPFVYWDVRA